MQDSPLLFRLICRVIRGLTPRYTLSGVENLPPEPCVLIGNHAQMYGPLAAELHLPRPARIWCVGEMMDRREVPAYAFQDFWSAKPRAAHWFWRLASHVIARPVAYVLSHAHTIPVYHDARILSTFRRSVAALEAGEDLVIFPESPEPYNAVVTSFHCHFVDLAAMVYRRSGGILSFVPMYVAPRLGILSFGPPVRFDPHAPAEEERQRICSELMEAITAQARALPPHTVIPYLNIPKSRYPLNTDE